MRHIKCFEQFLYESNLLKVSIYYDYGVSQNTMLVWSNFFRKFFVAEPKMLNAETFSYQEMKNSDLVVIPGGVGYKESLSMTEQGKEDLKRWIREGGKLLAVCAGAFLVTEANDWSLGIVPLKHDREKNEHITEEILNFNFDVTEKGKEIFNTNLESITAYFHGGPAFFNTDECEILLRFQNELPHDSEINDYTKGLAAGAYSVYGAGKIITLSPHFEKTEMYQYMLSNAINYLLRQ